MSAAEAIAHWRVGAQEAWKWAERMAREGSNALAIFHCHLAVEKALKALYMEQKQEPAPHTHSLTHLASLLTIEWTEDELAQLQELTPFSSEARYDDVGWVNEQATTKFVEQWLRQSKAFLSRLHCGLDA